MDISDFVCFYPAVNQLAMPKEQNDGTWKLEIETTIENSFGTGGGVRLDTALYQSGKKVLDLPEKRSDIIGFDHVLCKQETVLTDVKKWSTVDPSLYENMCKMHLPIRNE